MKDGLVKLIAATSLAPLKVELSIGQLGSTSVNISARCLHDDDGSDGNNAQGENQRKELNMQIDAFAAALKGVVMSSWPGCSTTITQRISGLSKLVASEGVPSHSAGQGRGVGSTSSSG